jgi:hypothetical protein
MRILSICTDIRQLIALKRILSMIGTNASTLINHKTIEDLQINLSMSQMIARL